MTSNTDQNENPRPALQTTSAVHEVYAICEEAAKRASHRSSAVEQAYAQLEHMPRIPKGKAGHVELEFVAAGKHLTSKPRL